MWGGSSHFAGGGSAARPSSEQERLAQARLPGPKTWVLVASFLGFDALFIGSGVALIWKPAMPLERIGGWVLVISGAILFMFGVAYLVRIWCSARAQSQSLFCANDHDHETPDSI